MILFAKRIFHCKMYFLIFFFVFLFIKTLLEFLIRNKTKDEGKSCAQWFCRLSFFFLFSTKSHDLFECCIIEACTKLTGVCVIRARIQILFIELRQLDRV